MDTRIYIKIVPLCFLLEICILLFVVLKKKNRSLDENARFLSSFIHFIFFVKTSLAVSLFGFTKNDYKKYISSILLLGKVQKSLDVGIYT